MNVQLILAGSLAILGAGIHGVAGELLVVRRLSPAMLPASPLGGPRTTKSMIAVTWHLTTIAFLSIGCALLVAGAALHGDTARGIGFVAAGACTGFAALVIVLGAVSGRTPRSLLHHPAPLLLTATAALSWWGVL